MRYPRDVDSEMRDAQQLAARRRPSARELLSPSVRHVLLVGVGLAVFQQVTAINTVIYYAPTLLANAGFGNAAALLANVGNASSTSG